VSVPVVVMTSEKYLWTISPFAYLFNIYWSSLQEVYLVSDVLPKFSLPNNFHCHSMNGDRPLPKEEWSNGFIVAMENLRLDQFVLLLDDYWLCRTVDHHGIQTLAQYGREHRDVLRIDLTDDRFFAGDKYDIGAYGHYDMVETPSTSPYQMSLQAAIWNRDHLLSIMRPGLSPWEVELQISAALHDRKDLRVVGTRQCPIRYANVCQGGDPKDLKNLDKIDERHLQYLRERRWIPE